MSANFRSPVGRLMVSGGYNGVLRISVAHMEYCAMEWWLSSNNSASWRDRTGYQLQASPFPYVLNTSLSNVKIPKRVSRNTVFELGTWRFHFINKRQPMWEYLTLYYNNYINRIQGGWTRILPRVLFLVNWSITVSKHFSFKHFFFFFEFPLKKS